MLKMRGRGPVAMGSSALLALLAVGVALLLLQVPGLEAAGGGSAGGGRCSRHDVVFYGEVASYDEATGVLVFSLPVPIRGEAGQDRYRATVRVVDVEDSACVEEALAGKQWIAYTTAAFLEVDDCASLVEATPSNILLAENDCALNAYNPAARATRVLVDNTAPGPTTSPPTSPPPPANTGGATPPPSGCTACEQNQVNQLDNCNCIAPPIIATLTTSGSFNDYNAQSFRQSLANYLSVDAKQVDILAARSGSIIVFFAVKPLTGSQFYQSRLSALQSKLASADQIQLDPVYAAPAPAASGNKSWIDSHKGLVIGVAAGVGAAAILLLLCLCICCKRRSRAKNSKAEQAAAAEKARRAGTAAGVATKQQSVTDKEQSQMEKGQLPGKGPIPQQNGVDQRIPATGLSPAGAAAAAVAGTAAAGAGARPLAANAVEGGEVEPAYELKQAAEPGWMELVVYMPLLASARDIDAEVLGGDTFQLTVPGRYLLKLALPQPVDPDSCSIRFDSTLRRLTARLRNLTDEEAAAAGLAIAPPEGEVEPSYELRHSGGQPWLELVVWLPLLNSARDIDAEVANGDVFKLHVGGRYALDLRLPQSVDPDSCSISFDKGAHRLTARLRITEEAAAVIEGLGAGSEAAEPAYELRHTSGQPWLELVVWLPLLTTAKDIFAEVLSGDVFKMTAEGKYALSVQLPHQVDPESCSIKFNSTTRRLRVRMQIVE
eukprot:jgi/Chlat1/1278/Chrsp117S01704